MGTVEADPSKKPQLIERITRDMVPFRPPASDDKDQKSSPVAVKKAETQVPVLLPISIVAETPSNDRKPKELSEDFAPFGRLIQCELIVTVDSSSINTPVIGLVTENVYHHGHLIIPTGTEVHGTAQVDRVRERIASDGRWTLVWQTGEELRVSGLALDREKDADGDGWGITDGSAGLRGRLLKRDDLAEIKMFVATLLSGAAEAFTEKRTTAFGSFAVPSLTNAPLQGAQAVLDRYASQIQQSIEARRLLRPGAGGGSSSTSTSRKPSIAPMQKSAASRPR
ncbi:MAG: TrbI/VirB10 family protein [Chthoniobacter sp.]